MRRRVYNCGSDYGNEYYLSRVRISRALQIRSRLWRPEVHLSYVQQTVPAGSRTGFSQKQTIVPPMRTAHAPVQRRGWVPYLPMRELPRMPYLCQGRKGCSPDSVTGRPPRGDETNPWVRLIHLSGLATRKGLTHGLIVVPYKDRG